MINLQFSARTVLFGFFFFFKSPMLLQITVLARVHFYSSHLQPLLSLCRKKKKKKKFANTHALRTWLNELTETLLLSSARELLPFIGSQSRLYYTSSSFVFSPSAGGAALTGWEEALNREKKLRPSLVGENANEAWKKNVSFDFIKFFFFFLVS